MVVQELLVFLSGGAPWGFRLQGGVDYQKPLQVAKVRRRSKACRAGLKEHDELVAIDDHMCAELSHAQAMSLLDTQSTTLNLRVKRMPPGFQSSSYSSRIVLPHTLMGTLSPPLDALQPLPYHGVPIGITSPPDSEAYYGETDSDADTQSQPQRRQRRTPPHARSPARYDDQEEETSEMSGYESATDVPLVWEGQTPTGIPRRELIYQPLQNEWATPAHTPHSLTLTLDPGLAEAEGEGDSGFQEVLTCPLLASPRRAKEALLLNSGTQLVPMFGLQEVPLSNELSATYRDKARQAKLQRGDSLLEKQVKEARTKCRSIASLLTDAPNPNSKGVLMFKKRRQRAKKYTLTCFGKGDGDGGGGTGGETEEEGGSSIQSGSEVDEEGFSVSFDPTWDSGYLDLLDRRSSACPSTTPTTPSTPTAILSPGLDLSSIYQSPGLLGSINQSPRLVTPGPDGTAKQPIATFNPVHMSPLALSNGGSVTVSRASVILSSPLPAQNGNADLNPTPNVTDSDLNNNFGPNLGVMNRTARPFTPGPSSSRGTVTSVMFRPPQPKPLITPAVSMVTISPTIPDVKVSSTSLYIPPRNNNSLDHTPPSVHSTPSSLSSTSLSQPHTTPPKANPPPPHLLTSPLTHQATSVMAPPTPHLHPPEQVGVSVHPPPSPSVNPYTNTTVAVTPVTHAPVQTTSPTSDSVATREQRISVPAARTGILNDACRRSNKKPMFSAIQNKDVSPNPALLSMVQNMDDRYVRGSGATAVSCDTGHESGPEEDWLRLGAEACNFMQAQRGHKPPPVAPKPQVPQLPQFTGKGGQLFARRQSRMDRDMVEQVSTFATTLSSPAQTREPSPTPSLPAAWKYSSNIRAPPPISYNPLLSPSCPPKAQKKLDTPKFAGWKGQKLGVKPVDVMSHQPYQLNSSLFSYGAGAPQDPSYQQQPEMPGGVQKLARVYEVKRFSTPPPTITGRVLKVIVPRSATTLGEPLWRSELMSPPPSAPYQPQWDTSPLSSLPPAPTAPLPQLPTLSSTCGPVQPPTFHPNLQHFPTWPPQANRQFKSTPDLSPLGPPHGPLLGATNTSPPRVPRPRFSTSTLGLQPSIWRPGSTLH